MICHVRAIKQYLNRTEQYHKDCSCLFISYGKVKKLVSKNTRHRCSLGRASESNKYCEMEGGRSGDVVFSYHVYLILPKGCYSVVNGYLFHWTCGGCSKAKNVAVIHYNNSRSFSLLQHVTNCSQFHQMQRITSYYILSHFLPITLSLETRTTGTSYCVTLVNFKVGSHHYETNSFLTKTDIKSDPFNVCGNIVGVV